VRKDLVPFVDLAEYWSSFLYALYIALDANFRLQRRDVSSETKDPGFIRGWVFFSEVNRYMEHLEKNAGQTQEVSPQ
jgi:hypothetical protein